MRIVASLVVGLFAVVLFFAGLAWLIEPGGSLVVGLALIASAFLLCMADTIYLHVGDIAGHAERLVKLAEEEEQQRAATIRLLSRIAEELTARAPSPQLRTGQTSEVRGQRSEVGTADAVFEAAIAADLRKPLR